MVAGKSLGTGSANPVCGCLRSSLLPELEFCRNGGCCSDTQSIAGAVHEWMSRRKRTCR